ncbi:MAG: hypothetical protein ACPK85_10045 [Methanosarcina sp.]
MAQKQAIIVPDDVKTDKNTIKTSVLKESTIKRKLMRPLQSKFRDFCESGSLLK